jgi:hypothetical protein
VLDKPETAEAATLETLAKHHIAIQSLRQIDPSIEDVFFQLTGETHG